MVSDEEVHLIAEAIRTHSSYDFSDYSEKSFARRIEKILTDNQLSPTQLAERLRKDPAFLEYSVQEITVNTTELFRDVDTWHAIKYRILPKLRYKDEINIWHAGCSTGQEVYSMAILLWEAGLYERSNLLATDLNTDVLEKARQGVYQYRFNREYLESFDKVMRSNPFNYEEVFDVPDAKYLQVDKAADTLRVNEFLKKRIHYMPHNLVSLRPPLGVEFDMVLCRNVLIYFNNNLQNKLFDVFYDSLVPKGFLVLGKHETMLGPKAAKFNKRGVFYTKKTVI